MWLERALGILFVCSFSACGGDHDRNRNVGEEEAALTDSAGCLEEVMQRNAEALEAQGYEPVGSTPYEILSHVFDSVHYWKQVTALRYEKEGRVQYATCSGNFASPLRIDAQPRTLSGTLQQADCAYPCRNDSEYVWRDGSPGTATVVPKDFGWHRLGGGEQVNLQFAVGSGASRVEKSLFLNHYDGGPTWSTSDRQTSLSFLDDEIVSATVSLEGKKRFVYTKKPPEPETKAVALVYKPRGGLKVVPSELTFPPSETGHVKIRNGTTFRVKYESPGGPSGTLNGSEEVTVSVGLPNVIHLIPFPGASYKVDLKVESGPR